MRSLLKCSTKSRISVSLSRKMAGSRSVVSFRRIISKIKLRSKLSIININIICIKNIKIKRLMSSFLPKLVNKIDPPVGFLFVRSFNRTLSSEFRLGSRPSSSWLSRPSWPWRLTGKNRAFGFLGRFGSWGRRKFSGCLEDNFWPISGDGLLDFFGPALPALWPFLPFKTGLFLGENRKLFLAAATPNVGEEVLAIARLIFAFIARSFHIGNFVGEYVTANKRSIYYYMSFTRI